MRTHAGLSARPRRHPPGEAARLTLRPRVAGKDDGGVDMGSILAMVPADSGVAQLSGPELDDLACQAAADALMAITGKLGQFRGESRFTTWACKFAIFEVSAKIGRHFWRYPAVPLDAEDWDRLPDRFGLDPAREAEWRDLAAALRRAVDEELTPRQRQVFVAIVLKVSRWMPWSSSSA